MIIILKGYRISPKSALRMLGYRERKMEKDYIREDHEGRFHAVIDKQAIILHYDLYVDWRHVVFHMPIKMGIERKRMMKKLYYFQTYKISMEERRKLMASY